MVDGFLVCVGVRWDLCWCDVGVLFCDCCDVFCGVACVVIVVVVCVLYFWGCDYGFVCFLFLKFVFFFCDLDVVVLDFGYGFGVLGGGCRVGFVVWCCMLCFLFVECMVLGGCVCFYVVVGCFVVVV